MGWYKVGPVDKGKVFDIHWPLQFKYWVRQQVYKEHYRSENLLVDNSSLYTFPAEPQYQLVICASSATLLNCALCTARR